MVGVLLALNNKAVKTVFGFTHAGICLSFHAFSNMKHGLFVFFLLFMPAYWACDFGPKNMHWYWSMNLAGDLLLLHEATEHRETSFVNESFQQPM